MASFKNISDSTENDGRMSPELASLPVYEQQAIISYYAKDCNARRRSKSPEQEITRLENSPAPSSEVELDGTFTVADLQHFEELQVLNALKLLPNQRSRIIDLLPDTIASYSFSDLGWDLSSANQEDNDIRLQEVCRLTGLTETERDSLYCHYYIGYPSFFDAITISTSRKDNPFDNNLYAEISALEKSDFPADYQVLKLLLQARKKLSVEHPEKVAFADFMELISGDFHDDKGDLIIEKFEKSTLNGQISLGAHTERVKEKEADVARAAGLGT